MKYYENRTQKTRFWALVSAAALVLVLTVSIIVDNLVKRDADTSTVDTSTIEILEGEARQSGLALAYPTFTSSLQIKYIHIINNNGVTEGSSEKNEFGVYHAEGDNYHTLFYVKNGEQILYMPEIEGVDAEFQYTDLFAIETGDGIGRYSLVDYLCAAVQSPYFNERIPFETDPVKLEAQMKEYGLDDEHVKIIETTFVDDSGKTVDKLIKIGDRGIVGTGYYFIVAEIAVDANGDPLLDANGNKYFVERPYVYSSLNNYFGYAETNIENFLKPLLVSDGLDEDNGYGPFLTTEYRQWINTFHDGSCECEETDRTCPCNLTGGGCDKNTCVCPNKTGLTTVTDESNVIVFADTVFSITGGAASSDGYDREGKKLVEIDLKSYKDALDKLNKLEGYVWNYESRNYARMLAVLAGQSIGDYSNTVTTYAPKKLIDFADKSSVDFEYTITAVEAIITTAGDITAPGASAGDEYSAIKVTYTATSGGESVSAHPLHAVIDLSYASLTSEEEAALRAAKIGEPLNIKLSVSYTAENAVAIKAKYIITEIIDVFDEDGKEAETITSSSTVGYRYKVVVDGIDKGSATFWLDLSKAEGEDVKIKNALIGKKAGETSISFNDITSYYEFFFDTTTYEISGIDSFVTRELVSAFKFQNSSKRDPYYGESLYENLFDSDDERRLYGLSSGVCETVVKILGGLSDESTTATAAGLTGDKVVAVGLTPDVMMEYGLYAHTIYFELPRGIKAVEPETEDKKETDKESLDDYIFRNTLGFNLYISEVDPETNMRYIASDLYDIVTRVAAEDFVFLDYDFETFWARRNIILTNISEIASVGVEFLMEDLKGDYTFDLTQPANTSSSLGVYVTSWSDDATPNKFTEFMANPDYDKYKHNDGTSLKNLYLYMSGATPEQHEDASPDTLGASCFREAMLLIYYVSYVDILSDEERAEAPNPDDLVFKMTLLMKNEKEKSEGDGEKDPPIYVYEYYRIDDRRVRVCIYKQEGYNGKRLTSEVDDFYISTFAFKKIVSAFNGVLNAEIIDSNVGYRDEQD